MGVVTVTLAGHRATDVRLTIPAWGSSYHEVSLDGEITLTGLVTLVVADLTVQCTVISGGPAAGRSFYRLVAGHGGWGKTLPRKSYANDLGVKLATVLGDAAQECGEVLDTTTIDGSTRLGPAFVRAEGPACRVLQQVAPAAWYVGEDGKTRLGTRAPGVLKAQASATTQIDLARGTVTLASETIANILPGLVVDGLTAVDVEHTADAKSGLRSKIWGRQGVAGVGNSSRRLSALYTIIQQLDPDKLFRSVWEYRVVTIIGNRLNLQPVRVSTSMPDLQRVPMWSAGGYHAEPTLGSRVLVSFIDADPARPVATSFEDPDGPGFVPSHVYVAGGSAAVGRVGDSVQVTLTAGETGRIFDSTGHVCTLPGGDLTLSGTIVSGSPKVFSG